MVDGVNTRNSPAGLAAADDAGPGSQGHLLMAGMASRAKRIGNPVASMHGRS
jgi:hypothetical protein